MYIRLTYKQCSYKKRLYTQCISSSLINLVLIKKSVHEMYIRLTHKPCSYKKEFLGEKGDPARRIKQDQQN